MQDTINADQCAALLQCTPETVEELTRKGELPGVKFGRGWIYVKSDLLAYLAEKGRREAEERRSQFAERCGTPAPLASLVKPRRQAPPALPQPPKGAPSGPRPGSLHIAAP
ncbi:helix-turn-helix domain-containing protein [Melaminivora sp.]|uniref:helix-turn-helix domain-containing protein n=1 Tax=Melaminivora sp. TaxID=1933032 RepID=UPI0039182A85